MLIEFLYGFSKLRSYEKLCLEAFEKHLSPEAAEILRKQIEMHDYVKRKFKDKLVIFYCLKNPSYQNWPSDIKFPMRDEDINVAQVFLTMSEKKKSFDIRADIYLHWGRLCSIEFNQPPKFAKNAKIEVNRVWLLEDPMAVESFSRGSGLELNGWMAEWKAGLHLAGLKRPLSLPERDKIIKKTHALLPKDYLELTSQSEGCRIDDCVILGLSQIMKIMFPDFNFYVLAKIEPFGIMGVKEGETDGELYYIDKDKTVPRALGRSFRNAVQNIIGLPTEIN